jgi:hypothetical protein
VNRDSKFLPGLITIAAGAGLLIMGYYIAQGELEPQILKWQKRASEEAIRANKLAVLNQQLEARLARQPASPPAAVRPAPPPQPPPNTPRAVGESRVLSMGRAAVVLDGRATVTLLKITRKPHRAALRVRVLGGQEGTVILGPGSSVGVKVQGHVYHLVLKAIHTSSVSFTFIK